MDADNTIYLTLEWGKIVIECLPGIAPEHVARIRQLCREGYYDGATFHRVNEFVAQGGTHPDRGQTETGHRLRAEFSGIEPERGLVAMARGESPDSADSQFFIVKSVDEEWRQRLKGQFTVWGRITAGMEHVDRIRSGSQEIEVEFNGAKRKVSGLFAPDEPQDRIVTMRLAAG